MIELVRFFFVGGVVVFFSYLTFLILLPIFSVSLSLFTSYVVGIFLGYILNRNWTFRFRQKKSFVKYFLLYLSSYILNLIILNIIIIHSSQDIRVIQLLLILLFSIFNFFALKFIVFKGIDSKL